MTVLGAGAFGTALAIAIGRSGASVVLWGRDAEAMADIQSSRENARYLPGAVLPPRVTATAELTPSDVVLLALPAQRLRPFLDRHGPALAGRVLVACCKGIDLTTMTGPSGLISAACPASRVAVLTGPSFAHDIARGLPTALTLACADRDTGTALQDQLSTERLRLYRSRDVTGAELGGALKNVIALACGASDGAGLGDSARAALITRGFAEMQRLALDLGAEPETLAGLSGFGDLVLTCTSPGSRNYRHGLAIGEGKRPEPGVTVEGVATAAAALALADHRGIDMPITQVVAGLTSGQMTVDTALAALMGRPQGKE